MLIDYDTHSDDVIELKNGKQVSLHDLVICYNQIQIMKKDGTYPKDFEYTFEGTVEIRDNE